MKHFNYYFIMMALAFVGFTSCSDDDEPELMSPTQPTISVTVSPEATEYQPGTELTFTIAAQATEGQLLSLEISPVPGGQLDSGLDSYFYNTSETVTYTYIVPFNADNVNIEFKVTAVNPEDYNLRSNASASKTFGVTNDFTEHKDIKLNDLWGNLDATSMLRLDTGATYSYQESYAGDDELKLSIDFFAHINYSDIDGVSTPQAWLLGTGGVTVGNSAVWVMWGDGSFTEKRGLDSNPMWNTFNQLDYDAFLPEDLYIGGVKSLIGVSEGDIIAFDNNPQGNYAPSIYPAYWQKAEEISDYNDVTGAIKIKEINYGTVGDGSDGYIIVDYKYVTK